MEDALRVCWMKGMSEDNIVLILILMEDALRDEQLALAYQEQRCLNPYSDGRCSKSSQR